jgi:UDP-N-acetylglucosamine/UDP-N-acetylgalactosamine 4-epimerase
MKRALVTGGCGFIGSNLTKELVKHGWLVDVVDDMSSGKLESLESLKLRILPNGYFIAKYLNQIESRDPKEVLVIQDDFSSQEMLKHIYNNYYDVVFHQGATPRVSYSVEHPVETTDNNITKTVALFNACVDKVDRIVFASSSSVYGGADNLPTSESEPKKPKSPYAWQKSAIENYAKVCVELYGLDVVCLRYFNVFGPGQYGDSPYSTAVSSWCHAIKNGLECRSDGDGTQTRDMCYIDNVVDANIRAANFLKSESFKGACYNVACGYRTSNNEILNYLKDMFGSKVRIKHSPEREGDVKHTQADISEIKRIIGYEPSVRFWEGLDMTIDWWGLKK